MRYRSLPLLFLVILAAALGCAEAAVQVSGPYLNNVTQNSVVVCFLTEEREAGRVRYGLPPALDRVTQDTRPVRVHKLRLTGLEPDTRYHYEVEVGDQRLGPFAFYTAVPPGSPFTFVAYGDNRSQPAEHAKVVRGILPHAPRFLVHTGDLVADGSQVPQWHEAFRISAPLFSSAVLFPSPGNHEGSSPNFLRFYSLPVNRRYYSFDYGDVHFVALDSTQIGSQEQRAWLEEDLERNRDRPFIIAFFHHTPYTSVLSNARIIASGRLRRAWDGLFRKYGVDLVFSGHDHNYQHHYVRGLHYIVTGGGGAPLYDVKKRSFTVANERAYNFVVCRVADGVLSLRALTPEGQELDRLVLKSRRQAAAAG